MTSTLVPTHAPDRPAPLSTLQRLKAHDQLTVLWRRAVDDLTQLSVELYGFGHDAPAERGGAVGERPRGPRRTLVEVEMALKKLRSGTYGTCDACEGRMAGA